MKRSILILLCSLPGFFSAGPLAAQWQLIGWNGGLIAPQAQLGNTLYGFTYYSMYRSTDWGKTWTIFSGGLPVNAFFYVHSYHFPSLRRNGEYLFFDNINEYNTDSTLFETGVYYCKEHDEQWSFKQISKIHGVAAQILFWSSDTVCAFRSKNALKADSLDGFYFSVDSGSSWQQRTPAVSVGQSDFMIPMQPHFFLGVNFDLYRTDNFGETWEKLSPPFGFSGNIQALSNTELMQQVTDTDDVFHRSYDYGKTWQSAGVVLPANRYFSGMKFETSVGGFDFLSLMIAPDPRNNYLLAGSKNRPGVWQQVVIGDSTVAIRGVCGKENYFIFTTSKGIYTSDSTFSTFTPLIQSGMQALEGRLLAVVGTKLFALSTRNNILYGLSDSLLCSDDNGTTWTQKPFLGGYQVSTVKWILDHNNLYAAGIQKDSNACIFRSTDMGNTWKITAELSSPNPIIRFFIEGDTMVILRLSEMLQSIDGGISWISQRSIPLDHPENIFYQRGVFLDPERVDAPNSHVVMTSSMDFGASWHAVENFNSFFDATFATYIYGSRWFGTYSNESYNTYYQNIGESAWTRCGGLPGYLLTIPSCNENGILYATGVGAYGSISDEGHSALYYSLDTGAHWKQLGDYVTNSPDVFIGSDYLFLAGPTELWRGPKPAGSNNVNRSASSTSLSLADCFPNPATTEISIRGSIPKHGKVVLTAYDISGRKIMTIISEEHEAGSFETVWNVWNVPNGSYIVKLSACGDEVTKIVEVLK